MLVYDFKNLVFCLVLRFSGRNFVTTSKTIHTVPFSCRFLVDFRRCPPLMGCKNIFQKYTKYIGSSYLAKIFPMMICIVCFKTFGPKFRLAGNRAAVWGIFSNLRAEINVPVLADRNARIFSPLF